MTRRKEPFTWTPQRVAILHQAYAYHRSKRLADAAQLIADQLTWPIYAIQEELRLGQTLARAVHCWER